MIGAIIPTTPSQRAVTKLASLRPASAGQTRTAVIDDHIGDKLSRQTRSWLGLARDRTPMDPEFHKLLGMALDEAAQTQLVRSLNDAGEVIQITERCHLLLRQVSMSLTADERMRVIAVMFYRAGYQGLPGFSHPLPEGLDFSHTREEVLRLLGPPASTGGEKVVEYYGKIPKWDRFERPDHWLHVEYCDDDQGIKRVTLMAAVPQ